MSEKWIDTSATVKVRCPHCGIGLRVISAYQHGGMMHDDSYCNRCGKNWPKLTAKLAQGSGGVDARRADC